MSGWGVGGETDRNFLTVPRVIESEQSAPVEHPIRPGWPWFPLSTLLMEMTTVTGIHSNVIEICDNYFYQAAKQFLYLLLN